MKSFIRFSLPAIILLLLCGCQHLPGALPEVSDPTPEVLWDLNAMLPTEEAEPDPVPLIRAPSRTESETTVSRTDFEAAFAGAVLYAGDPLPAVISEEGSASKDGAEWQYFSPAEFSSDPMDQLIVSFKNTGDLTWTQDYSLVWFAGENPSSDARIVLNEPVAPEESCQWYILIKSHAENWKSCWQLQNNFGVSFYEFCYNHGSGESAAPQSDSAGSSADNSGVFFAFVKTNGAVPASAVGNDYASSGVSLNPGDGHTFCAYDHTENLLATFTNTGESAWDSSVALRFYSDYNWMHTDIFPVNGTVEPGESYTFTMPMEIIEDNDNWSSCWYLSAPDGSSMSSFCFVYHTRSC